MKKSVKVEMAQRGNASISEPEQPSDVMNTEE